MRNGKIISVEYQSIVEMEKENIIELYYTLEQLIFDRYVRSKTLKLNRVIDNSMLCDGINWEMAPEPRGARNHCLQLLLEIVFIHNEVYNSAKMELDNVLKSLLEKIANHMLATIKVIDRFSPTGAMQVLIEVDFIKETLQKYLTELSLHVFDSMKQLLMDCIAQDNGMYNTLHFCSLSLVCTKHSGHKGEA